MYGLIGTNLKVYGFVTARLFCLNNKMNASNPLLCGLKGNSALPFPSNPYDSANGSRTNIPCICQYHTEAYPLPFSWMTFLIKRPKNNSALSARI